ncbi:MAG TPA: serine hydrolase domain-containing protein [Bacteroidia bacterium]|nr:serine hydrolase domain-containing protein [Bacteroidia bacterium]
MQKAYIIIGVFALVYSCNPRESVQQSVDNYSPITNVVAAQPKDTVSLLLQKLDAKDKAHQIDSFFTKLAEKNRFNGDVLVAQEGQIIYENSFGIANRKTKDSLTLKSDFQLGSVSKQFTAVAIMMLKERGKLDYSDTIQKFFPDFPYKGITIKMLLTHRSGLPNYMYFCDAYCKSRTEYISNMDVIHIMEQYKPEKYFKPNHRYQYSNTGYCMLAAIVEQVSGMPFADFMKKNVFEPLHMNNTMVFNLPNDTLIPNETTGYDRNGRKSGFDYLDGVVGDKGIYSDLGDLFKWDQALYTNKLLKQSTLEEAFQPYSKEFRGDKNYGFGWRILKTDEGKVVFHSGWWHGYNCVFIRRLSDKSTIIVLSNHVNWCINGAKNLLNVLSETKDTTDMDLSD